MQAYFFLLISFGQSSLSIQCPVTLKTLTVLVQAWLSWCFHNSLNSDVDYRMHATLLCHETNLTPGSLMCVYDLFAGIYTLFLGM